MKTNKKILIITTLLALIFVLSACSGVATQPKKDYGDYEPIEGGSGYAVSGVITDQSGNALPNVNLLISNKIRGMTNSKGEYKITNLKGSNTIVPEYNDYVFNNKSIVVDKAGEVNFSGKNSYSLNFNSMLPNNMMAEGVTYVVNGKTVASKNGMAQSSGLNGKTTITAHHPSFDFYPSEMVVYSYNDITFMAKPKQGTFSVSGIVTIPNATEETDINGIRIAVDGKEYSNIYKDYVWDGKNDKMVYKYNVYGLDPNEAGGYKISLIDKNGDPSTQTFAVTESTSSLNFVLQIQKEIKFQVKFSNLDILTNFDQTNLDDLKEFWDEVRFRINIKDADGNVIDTYSKRPDFEIYEGEENFPWEGEEIWIATIDGVYVFEGCTVEVTGDYDHPNIDPAVNNGRDLEYIFDDKDRISRTDLDDPKDYTDYPTLSFKLELVEEEDD